MHTLFRVDLLHWGPDERFTSFAEEPNIVNNVIMQQKDSVHHSGKPNLKPPPRRKINAILTLSYDCCAPNFGVAGQTLWREIHFGRSAQILKKIFLI